MPRVPSLTAAGRRNLVADGGRTPPASLEAEQSVLGGILIKEGAMDLVSDLLIPEDFYYEAHGVIFRAMLELYYRREPVDLVTVASHLRSHNLLDAVGGPGFLASLTENVATAVNIDYYAKIVHEKSLLRRLSQCAAEIAQECYEPQDDVEKFLDEAEHRIFAIAEAKMRSGITPLNELLDLEITRLQQLFETKRLTTGVPSHFRDLDEYTHGFQKSDLIIIAARPSMGKTAFALNIAFNAAHYHKVPVVFFSLEMSKEQLVRRLFSAVARVDATALRRGFFSREEFAKLQEAASFMMGCPLYIDDTPAARVLEVRAKCRRLKRDKNLGLVIIDYLQLMRGRSDAPSREQEISEISRSLKALAKELDIPVIALSQLNRRVEERPNKRPMLADLRESGAIEQDADVIIFIYRDEVYRPDSPDRGVAEIIIGKQRNGRTGTFKMHFASQFTRFDDFSPRTPYDLPPEEE